MKKLLSILVLLTALSLRADPPITRLGQNTNDIVKPSFFGQNDNAGVSIRGMSDNGGTNKLGTNLLKGFLPAWSVTDPSSVGGGGGTVTNSFTNFNRSQFGTNAGGTVSVTNGAAFTNATLITPVLSGNVDGITVSNLNASLVASGTLSAPRLPSALQTLNTNDGQALTNLNASKLATGTVPTAQLGSGTASGSTFLRGDQTWATPSGGGGGTATNLPDSQVITNAHNVGNTVMRQVTQANEWKFNPDDAYLAMLFGPSGGGAATIYKIYPDGTYDNTWGGGGIVTGVVTNTGILTTGNINATGTIHSDTGFDGDAGGLTGIAPGLDAGTAENAIHANNADSAEHLDEDADYNVNNFQVNGKFTAAGSMDPPLVLYDAHTRAETKARVLREVPDCITNITFFGGTNVLSNIVFTTAGRVTHRSPRGWTNVVSTNLFTDTITIKTNVLASKLTGASLFFCTDTHKLETYVASENKFYDLTGAELVAPSDLDVVNATTALLKTPQFQRRSGKGRHSRTNLIAH